MKYYVYLLVIILFIGFILYLNIRNINSITVSSIIDYKYKIKFPFLKNNNPYNSSIIKENDKYIVYTRIDNMSLKNDDDRKVYLGISIFDKNLNLIKQKIDYPETGNFIIEDLRVFTWKNKKYFIGTKWDKYFYPVILDEFYNIYSIVDEQNNEYKNDKNYSPLIFDNKLLLIKNHNPLHILEVNNIKNNKVETTPYFKKNIDYKFKNLRGNTRYIFIGNNKYLGITHTMNHIDLNSIINWEKSYGHFFIILNFEDKNNIKIEKISKPVCFLGNCGIEFVMGIEESYDKNNYIITLGKSDKEAYLVSISKSKINNLF
jgi:hypothetical protein